MRTCAKIAETLTPSSSAQKREGLEVRAISNPEITC